MSRSIGDLAVKPIGVIAEPELFHFDLPPHPEFLILGSDGLWEFIDNEEAVRIVDEYLDEGVPVATRALIQEAAQRWQDEEGDYRDDVS